MFISIPIAPINTISDVPPAEINGSGIPVGGIEPVTTAMLIISFAEISAVIHVAKYPPSRSLALYAIFIPSYINSMYKIESATQPTNPNSSPIIEKIISDMLTYHYKEHLKCVLDKI